MDPLQGTTGSERIKALCGLAEVDATRAAGPGNSEWNESEEVSMGLESKSVKELRELAKKRKLSGYSSLGKADLVRLLEPQTRKTAAPATAGAKKQKPAATQRTKPRPAAVDTKQRAKPKRVAQAGKKKTAAEKDAAAPPTLSAEGQRPETRTTEEQQIEDAKFALVATGLPHREFPPDLGEDIDNLPPLTEPLLCLLPQKPGVLHAYWFLEPGMLARKTPLRLRLGVVTAHALQIVEEVLLKSERGYWYFQVDESLAIDEAYLQVGHYQNGKFITAMRRGIARVPSLYASARTDRYWWISPEQFREMYLRAGGFKRGAELGWSRSISSR